MRRGLRDASLALGLVLGAGSVAMLVAHVNPLDGFGALLDGAFGTRSEIAETLVQTTSLLFPALGIALAFRAGLFNIGAEGQLLLGGLCAGALGGVLAPLAPPFVVIIAALLAGVIGGGAWGAIAGVLRARFGANEVIATLMLNIVAALLATYLVGGPLRALGGNGSETPLLPRADRLPALIPDTRLTLAFVLALGLAFAVRWLLARTVFGYELRAAGDAPEVARRAGIDLSRIALLALTLSGAIAGLGGACIVEGSIYRFNTGLSPGYGFIAIAVALVGNLEPMWICVAALGFGVLQSGAIPMQAEAGVPRDVVAIVEGLVIIALAGRRVIAAQRRA